MGGLECWGKHLKIVIYKGFVYVNICVCIYKIHNVWTDWNGKRVKT